MKDDIRNEIEQFIALYEKDEHTQTHWRRPLVGFASAVDPLFDELKRVASNTHAHPQDLLSDGQTVIAFFLPFEKDVGRSNLDGQVASLKWAYAYIETNALIEKLGLHIQDYLEALGYSVEVIPPTHNFDPINLVSDWSHRHVAFIAGLGRFGLNNMLITKSGCCGRVGSLITSMELEGDIRPERRPAFFIMMHLVCVALNAVLMMHYLPMFLIGKNVMPSVWKTRHSIKGLGRRMYVGSVLWACPVPGKIR